MRQTSLLATLCAVAMLLCVVTSPASAADAAQAYHQDIQPLLSEYCGDCHLDGMEKGGVAFDSFKSDHQALTNKQLWSMVLKNVRGNVMPPPKHERLSDHDRVRLVDWIKYGVFGIDPGNIDPGRVTVRRLNRVEYRNTIRDLVGVDYDTDEEFPPDDTGYGFDDIGDVLNLSPMLLEKYLDAAGKIVAQAVPTVSHVMPEATLSGASFHPTNEPAAHDSGALALSYYDAKKVVSVFQAEHGGRYQVGLDLTATEHYVDDQFDTNRCRLTFKVDGREVERRVFGREGYVAFHFDDKEKWKAGPHEFSLEIQPLTSFPHIRSLALRIDRVTISGPDDTHYWVEPKNYRRFFPKPAPPGRSARRAYARELLTAFATKAYRRPVDADTADRLTDLAMSQMSQSGTTFEAGVGRAMEAVLASPQFLFREERAASSGTEPLIDEYSLASRLSYFLWSTMPDDELFSLAAQGKLRANLDSEVKRMLADPKAAEFTRNFVGQWLQARDIEFVALDPRLILAGQDKTVPHLEEMRDRYHELQGKNHLTDDEKAELKDLREKFGGLFKKYNFPYDELRSSLREEVEMYFSNIVKEDRSVLEFVDSDYTFLNQRLAKFYGLTNLDVKGSEMRLVHLPANCERGGVLTMGGVLALTSNPTRTSPVKRGLFILENFLGNPPPPPPPNLPPLEDSDNGKHGHELTLRETLAIHRDKPLCASCHAHMDPLGLAFENFNALGGWRETDHGEPVDASGQLLSGEKFQDARDLKRILAANHRDEFYRTLTEKLLTYAVGRGMDYKDTETVDRIVEKLDQANGRFSVLLNGVIESAPFQRTRPAPVLGEQAAASTKEKT